MSIKRFFVRMAEKLTGRKCSECRHSRGGRCCHPNGMTFMWCWNSITRPGWEYSFGKTYSRLCASLVQLLKMHAKRGLTKEDELAVHTANQKLLAAAIDTVEVLPESKKRLYEKTVRRMNRCGAKDPTTMIIFLAEEIEHYRAKIGSMERHYCGRYYEDEKTESGLITED